eukprot:3409569-Rhodomonas_salina.3
MQETQRERKKPSIKSTQPQMSGQIAPEHAIACTWICSSLLSDWDTANHTDHDAMAISACVLANARHNARDLPVFSRP